MGNAQIIEVADAVVAELNGHAFSQDFAAERAFMPVAELADLTSLKVWVVPKAEDIAPVSRTGNEVHYQVDVALQMQARTVAQCDPLMALAEEIADFLDRRRLPAIDATWAGTGNAPIWDPKDLAERHVFTTVITVTYRMSRPAPA